jgi:hypothetical protein
LFVLIIYPVPINRFLTVRVGHAALCLAVFIAFSFGYGSVLAKDESHEIEVSEHGGVYRINATVLVDAPAEYVREVLSDFRHIYRLNPSIIESEVLASSDDKITQVRTRVLGCAGYFCEELERVEKVSVLPSGDLVAVIVPELSQFRSGKTIWHILSIGERSRVVYESEMEPDFYIPPVVGKFIAKQSIRTEVATSFANLERIANVFAERDWKQDFMLSNLRDASDTPCELAANK